MGSAKQVPTRGQKRGCAQIVPTVMPCFNIVGKTAGHLTNAALALAWAFLVRIAGWSYWRSQHAV
eukprot:12567199-Alexandrium_andersonii.AAC.1